MSSLEIVPSSDALDYHIRNENEHGGWDFKNGDPEIYKYSDQLISPGGRVLDLGSGALRASAFFALNGMKVVAIDTDGDALDQARNFAKEHHLQVHTEREDIETFCHTDISDPYEVVMMAQSTVHAESRARALKLAKLGYERVAPGGHFWFRAATILDDHYKNLGYMGMPKTDETTYEVPCSCSGTIRIEPVTFLNPLDIHLQLANEGAHFVHSQVLPTKGYANIMYGEDFNPQIPVGQSGFVTVLAQKPHDK